MVRRFWKQCIVVVAIMIGIFLVPLALDHFIFGNTIKSNLNNSEWSSFLGSYTGGVIGGIATLIAVILSLNISRKIQNESELRENSLIIYYDLVLGLTDLKKLFISVKNKKYKNTPSKLFFSKEWIKNVAKIASNLEDTNTLYKLYGDLEVIGHEIGQRTEFQILKDITMDFNEDRYEKNICKLSEKVFSKKFFESDLSKYDDDDVKLNIQQDLKENLANIILGLEVSLRQKK